jgi:hypothetical protein
MHTQKSIIIAIISILAAAFASIGCAFDQHDAIVSIDLTVPEYAAVAKPGAKLISPDTAEVGFVLTYPDGVVVTPPRVSVQAGVQNRIPIRVRYGFSVRVTVSTYDAMGAVLCSGEIVADLGASSPISLALTPSSGLIATIADPIVHASVITPSDGPATTQFFRAHAAADAWWCVSRADFGPCWIGAYDAATGLPLEHVPSNQGDGWFVFRTIPGKDFLIAVTDGKEDVGASTPLMFREAKFVRAGATGENDGSRENPYSSLSSVQIGGQTPLPNRAWLFSGSFSLTTTKFIEVGAVLLGAYASDFSARDSAHGKTVLSAIDGPSKMLATAGNDTSPLAIEGFRLVAEHSTPDILSAALALEHASTHETIVRDCEIEVADAAFSTADFPAVVCGLYSNPSGVGNSLTVSRCSINGRGVSDQNAVWLTIAGIVSGNGNLSVESTDIFMGPHAANFGYQRSLSAIALGTGSIGCTGDITISGCRLDSGGLGTLTSRSAGGVCAAISIQNDATATTVILTRSFLHGGASYSRNASPTSAGIFVQASSASIYAFGNVISAGSIDSDVGFGQSQMNTAAVLLATTCGGSMFGNTLEIGSINCPNPNGAVLRSTGLSVSSDANAPTFIGNALLRTRSGDGVASYVSFSSVGLLDAAVIERNVFMPSSQTIAISDPTTYDLAALNALNGSNANAEESLEAVFPGQTFAFSSALDLATGVFKPAASAPASMKSGYIPNDINSKYCIDIAGRQRPQSMSATPWCVGAYEF